MHYVTSMCVLQCVAVRCSVLQCVAVCCSVLQCVAVCCSVLPCVAVRYNVIKCVATSDCDDLCSVLNINKSCHIRECVLS